ncbi:MAG: putative cation transport-related protein [Benniella sp.]|nr:MAG: putative cation transport-related protein [Benniella sp.]
MALTCSDIFKFFFAIILPPLGVLLEKGCGCDFLINILLTILGYIPGIIHAFYIILKY